MKLDTAALERCEEAVQQRYLLPICTGKKRWILPAFASTILVASEL
jgi:hypothetical protein